mgnify:CR=1 FL=1
MYKNGKDIGYGIETFKSAKKYSQFKVKIKYKTKVTPDECEIMFSVFPGVDGTNEVTVHKGTTMYVDNLSLK